MKCRVCIGRMHVSFADLYIVYTISLLGCGLIQSLNRFKDKFFRKGQVGKYREEGGFPITLRGEL